MRYFLRLGYDGGPFHGWQAQPNAVSVQQTIEEALSIILRRATPIVGAGRTDTGVNAREMYAHFEADTTIDKKRVLNGLNRLCGPDISIFDILEVKPDAHARFDAVSRTYKYFITFEKSPFLKSGSYFSTTPLDTDKMNHAAGLLLKTDDFTSFAKLHSDAKTNICKVKEARWEEWHNEFKTPGIVFTITADRFLRNMVRAVVGTLVEVGRGKMNVEEFENVIKSKNRCAAGTSMPPQALFLWKIEYGNIFFHNKSVT